MDNKNYLNCFSILLFSLCMIQFTFAQESAVEWFNKGTEASNPDDKIRYYQKSIELDSNLIEAHYNLAYIYKNKNEHEKGLQFLNKALNLCGKKTDKQLRFSICYELGICYKRTKYYSKSIEMFENAKQLAKDKKIRGHVLYELGRVALLVEDFDKALAQFNEGFQISEDNKELFQTVIEMTQREKLLTTLYNEGMTFLQQRKYNQAVEVLSEVYELEPNYKDTNIRLIEAQNQMHKESDLASTQNVDKHLKEAETFFSAKKYEQALNKYKGVTEISPFNSIAYYNMGQCYEKLENNEMAIAAYQKALLLKSNFKEATLALTQLGGKPLDQNIKDANFTAANDLFLQKKYDEAIKEYNIFLKKNPLNFQAQFNLAFCYEQQGELNLAIEHYQESLKMNNASVEASQGLARVKAKRTEIQLTSLKRQIENDLDYKRFSSAKSRIEQYLNLNPKDRWALGKARDIDKAVESQKKAETPKERIVEEAPETLKETETPTEQSIEEVNLDTTAHLTQNEFMINDITNSDSVTKLASEPIQTEEKSQVFIYLIAGLIIISIGFIGFILKKQMTRKQASGKEMNGTSVHSFLTDCFSNKRTGIVIVESSIDSEFPGKGEICVHDGNITDAKLGNLTGINALNKLLDIDIPESLDFQEVEIPSSGNINQSTLSLLIQWEVNPKSRNLENQAIVNNNLMQ